jgi:PAS domain S-box-containing protein
MNSILPGAERKARILIVDDERLSRQVLQVMLSAEGYVVLTAANGEEALAGVADQPPDLILLDVTMPTMDGYQVTAQIKRSSATKNIPIILLTALDDHDSRMLGLNAGAEDFLTKPVDRAELCVRVRNLLRLKEWGDGETVERKEADERFRLLVDGVRDYAIFIVDPRGRVVTWNSGAKRIKGYSEKEIVGRHIRTFYSQEDAASGKPEEDLRIALAEGRMETEGWRVRKDGTRFWANVILTPLYDDAGKHLGFAKVTRDLTERRAMEDQLRQANKMEAIGRLAGGVAHDFNNLLSVILGYSEMIGGDLKPDEPLRGDIEEIRIAAVRATDLTRQLLAFSRQQVLEARVLGLNQSVARMEKMLRRLLGAAIELTILPAIGLWNVKADPGQIEQIVMKLVVNARDAMPETGKLTIETTNIELDDDYARAHHDVQPGRYVMLSVSDTGSGMDRETQTKIFEPFFTTKERGKGTGLGLAIVFGIVKQSGGHIWVYSELGEGTTFKVYLPRAQGAAELRHSERPIPDLVRGTETILLVEDDDQVRAVARNILRRNGYVVLEAPNGGEALLICEQHGAKIDLLLTDVVLPSMSGRQLAERVANHRPEIKVLFMSGYTDDGILQHGVLDSGVAYLQKPLTPTSLTRKVREVLRGGNGR